MREYGKRWTGKHPTPYDFWNTIEDVSGRDLDWFWKTWFYETWRLDQALDEVVTEGDSTRIVIANREKAIMPVILAVTREGGKVDTLTVPVETWFDGAQGAHRQRGRDAQGASGSRSTRRTIFPT